MNSQVFYFFSFYTLFLLFFALLFFFSFYTLWKGVGGPPVGVSGY